MKLLICTQKVDKSDSALGFFHRWIEDFAKHCEKVTVICLESGEYDLPKNVGVLSLGKEVNVSKFGYFWRFYKYIWQERDNYDSIFIHMNPEYIVLGGWLWKVLGKKMNLWYVHRQVNLKLRVAAFFANKIFSVAPGSIGLKSKKLRFVGHGIDTEYFKCVDADREKEDEVFKIISIGRIARIKNLDTLIKTVGLLRERIGRKFLVELVGEPVTNDDREYKKELDKLITDLSLGDIVKFSGVGLYAELPHIYCQSDLLINLAPTGGLDKVVLEAMACGLPVLVCNQSFEQFFGDYRSKLLFKYNDLEDLAAKVVYFMNYSDPKLGVYLRRQVVENHNIVKLIEKLSR